MSTHGAGSALRGHQRLVEARRTFWESDRSLTALLVFVVFSVFLAEPLNEFGGPGHFVLSVILTLVLISGVLTVAKTRTMALVLGGVAVASLAIHWVRFFEPIPVLDHADVIGTLLAIALLAVIVMTQVLREGPITMQRIQGAIAVYLMIGLMWAAVYGLVYLNNPQAFSFPPATGPSAIPVLRSRFVYFSFTTLTTVGYGDITAVSPLARSLAMLEAVVGQLFPTILIARLVSMEIYYRQRRFEREQAALDREALAREIERGRETGRDQ